MAERCRSPSGTPSGVQPAGLKDAGADNLVTGTDYCHNDTSSQIEALRMLRSNGSVPEGIVDKILGDNPLALDGL